MAWTTLKLPWSNRPKGFLNEPPTWKMAITDRTDVEASTV